MSEWKTTTLSAFISLQRGHDLPNRDRRPGPVPVVGSGGIAGWHDTSIVRGPGITIGRAANLGVPTLNETDFWPLNTTLYVTDFRGNDVRFTYYLLQTLDLTGFNSGSVQPMLNRNYIRNFPLAVPELGEQRRIAAVLGVLDDKIRANQKTFNTCLSLADTYLMAAIADVETDLRYRLGETDVGGMAGGPDGGWEFLSLQEVCDRGGGSIQTGPFGSQLHASDYTDAGVPVVMPQDIGNNVIHIKSIARIPPGEAQKQARFRLMSGDIVYSRRGDVERRALIRADNVGWVCGTGCLRIRPGSAVGSLYLAYYLGHEAVRSWIVRHAVGATMANLNTKILGSLPVLLPPRPTQEMVSGYLMWLDKVAMGKLGEVQSLTALRDTLLPKLLSGEIRVRDGEKAVEDAT